MASKVTFGRGGVKEVHSFGSMNQYEKGRLDECLAQLKEEIAAGVAYAEANQLAVEPRGVSRPMDIPAKPRAPPSMKTTPASGAKSGNFKVCVCGGAGGIGQPLCMFMAQNPHVSELCVFDLTLAMVPAAGVAADLSHLEKKSKVKGYALDKDDKPVEKLAECLTGCHLVLVPAGMPRKPGMTRADLLGVNAGIAKNIVEACAKYCPNAVLGLIVNPVNSVMPAMCELYKKKGLDHRKICGVTSLDIVRANKFVHEITGVPIETIDVPVVGGHAGSTILPLFSQVPAAQSIPAAQIPALDKHVQDAGTDVVNAKGGKGSATLSMAYAGAKFGNAVLSGLAGDEAVACTYVMREESEKACLPYLATKVTFGPRGIHKAHSVGSLNAHEKERYEKECLSQLKDEIDAGLSYAATTKLNF